MEKKSFLSAFICSLFLVACEQTDWRDSSGTEQEGFVFRLQTASYDNACVEEKSRSLSVQKTDYDRVEWYVTDDEGKVVENLKGMYEPASAELHLEGLKKGEYNLLLLGIRGQGEEDGAVIHRLRDETDEWITFPSDLRRPLSAEYFYSRTPFSVNAVKGPAGEEETVAFSQNVMLRRIVGRVDFSLSFNNVYVRNAVVSQKVRLEEGRFYTGLSGNGNYVGETGRFAQELDLSSATSYLFLPAVSGSSLRGEVEVCTRGYRGDQVRRVFVFDSVSVSANRIGQIHTSVDHPDDSQGLMYFTEEAYREGDYQRILQDGEPKEVYADSRQRSFNTSRPLQANVAEDGRLHLRFYSPRELRKVLVKARIPSAENEFFNLAYFESLPAFADFYQEMPLLLREGVYQTESGRYITLSRFEKEELRNMELKIEADDAYWDKLQKIKHGWNVSFNLYGGDPDKADGGPAGNWMGIRPVHCREAVALFINFTYMIDMPEHEEILRANEDRLYGNGGVGDKVTADVVLKQMRQERSLSVGLVYTGNNVYGLGGGSVFGAWQGGWFNHYTDTYACEVMFHELGHVMGYSHSSAFTYGPWAQELMNRFYVTHIHEMPVDSPDYLNSKNNPNKY